MTTIGKLSAASAGLLLAGSTLAGPVTVPNNFAAGTPAVAADMNANFAAVADAVNDSDARIVQLEADNQALAAANAELLSRLDTLESFVDDLRAVMSLENDRQGNPAVVFSGVNLHVNNGSGETEFVNGLGNLIVGYDEALEVGVSICSLGEFELGEDCLANNGVFAASHKSGSHSLVVGPYNSYSRAAGLAVGWRNAVTGNFATAFGRDNRASGAGSAAVGGTVNVAAGESSSVTGGVRNLANTFNASVNGGSENIAAGVNSVVAGGSFNIADGTSSTVSGGNSNTASGTSSAVSGGFQNQASGTNSSVSGGSQGQAEGVSSSVSGGSKRTAGDRDDWAAGSLLEDE